MRPGSILWLRLRLELRLPLMQRIPIVGQGPSAILGSDPLGALIHKENLGHLFLPQKQRTMVPPPLPAEPEAEPRPKRRYRRRVTGHNGRTF